MLKVWGMKQVTLASVGFERYAKTTRRAVFLSEMAQRQLSFLVSMISQ